MSHPLDEFLSTRSNTRTQTCVVCAEPCAALVILKIEKAGPDGQAILGPKSSRSKRFAMCAHHAVAMFERTSAEGLHP